VTLSRVTALNGLHLIELDREKIKCDEKAAAVVFKETLGISWTTTGGNKQLSFVTFDVQQRQHRTVDTELLCVIQLSQ